MKPFYDGAKNLFLAAALLSVVATSVAKISAITATGPIAVVEIAASIVAEECSPPMIWVSGKCIVAYPVM
jgi:hypothetical protein